MAALKDVKLKLGSKIKTAPPTRVIVVSFFALILAGTILLCLPISVKSGEVSPLTALFTATSASCVTGLVLNDTYSHWTGFGQVVIIALIQIGGLGIATFTTGFTLFIRRKIGIREMRVVSESSGSSFLDIRALLKIMIGFTFACEAVGALILMIRFVPQFGVKGIWTSVFLAISSYCNAGFDILGFIPGNSSLTHYVGDPLVSITIAVLIIIGGLGFVVVQDIYMSKLKHGRLFRDPVKLNFHSQICLLMTGVLLLIGTVGFLAFEYDAVLKDLTIFEKLNAAFFQSTSARTAGYASVNIAGESEFGKILTVVLMFIGACPGSTGGGIKVTTFAVLIMTVFSTVRGRTEIVAFRHRFSNLVIYKSLTVMALAFVIIFVDVFVIVTLNKSVGVLDAMIEATSAFATVGLSANLTPKLDTISKLLLCLTMFIGRVGPVAFGLTFLMRPKRCGGVILPEGRMIIG